ncbi:MAG: hypothetical protein NC429_15685 [Lachnospiraceae bacterium]|nr:hypothetical protein [Lachnospiraceae bacterium]
MSYSLIACMTALREQESLYDRKKEQKQLLRQKKSVTWKSFTDMCPYEP